MEDDAKTKGLELSEDEAGVLLDMCLTSPNRMSPIAQRALRKLAEYCASFEFEGSAEIIRLEQPREAAGE